MARGWESKSVEEQLASAEQDRARTLNAPISASEADRRRRRAVLESARNRTLQQLNSAANPRYRKLLEDELASLNEQIEHL